ncbi:MAG: two-component sensor histidine kinase [Bacteroidetes bacterium]|nr:two-component sensor histidine kinase [Fibrella sp.]
MKLIERHIFLILAVLAFGLSALCYVFLERDALGATDEQYLSTVQERVKAETQVSTDELSAVINRLASGKKASFADLKIPTDYPYFIFSNGRLLFWSDHVFIPDYDQLRAVKSSKLVDFEQGRYIVSHNRASAGPDTFDVFSLVNVYRRYKNANTYLQSGYNSKLFALDPLAINTQKGPTYQNIYDNTPAFLFSVVPPRVEAYRNHSTPVDTVILASMGILFLGLYVFRNIAILKRQRRYEVGFGWLATYLLLLRGGMLYFGVPFLFAEWDLFNPKFYASSALAPSLGDLLLNCLVVAILTYYATNHYYRSQTYRYLISQPKWARGLLSVGCVVLSYVVFQGCVAELDNIYDKSQFTLDITLSFRFSSLKVACLLVFICISMIYFLVMHLLTSLFIRVNASWPVGFGWLALGSLLAAGLFLIPDWPLDPILGLNAVCFLVLYVSRFPRVLYTFRYKTSIYLFFFAFICALTTSYVVYRQELRKDVVQKRDFAAQLLAENDEFGEFLLNKARESIAADPDIRRAFLADTVLVRERIQQRVKGIHLDKYFDKYDVEVLSFEANGQPLDNAITTGATFAAQTARYQVDRYRTQYAGVHFINEAGNKFIKQYISIIPIHQPIDSAWVGYVVLDLKLRNELPTSVYPELLVDKKFIQAPETRTYSYALYNARDRMLFSTGSYNFERKLPDSLLHQPDLYTTGISAYGYKHFGQRSRNGRTIVVSSADFPLNHIFSNFSFLYLVLVLTVIVAIVAYAINYGLSRFRINYSTRIQILLNLAFFLPLVLVVVSILSVISANYIANQEGTYISNTKNIAANFLAYLDENLQGKRSKASMEEELKKIARDADIDINLFDTKGYLYSSTRPLMYEGGHLSKYINPDAYIHIIEDKENQKLLDESLGSKQYRTAYAGIKSYDGRLLGILSVPYFYARPELDRQIVEVISSALSVFTVLFLLFMILSYFASTILTGPLKLVTQKIRKTNLDKLNEPIEWKSDDEIGLLVGEYNRMLLKLDESKRALSMSEKQSAWREMAKQVAHEIKNPLTPMKLTLQHLQRTLPGMNGNDSNGQNAATVRMFQRTFDSLLDHIDDLSDIATSFSDFAKMPLPRNDVFEITSVLTKAADLYADDEKIVLQRQIEPGPVMVIGDRQFMGRIITNLIINAIQSVPIGRKPVIDLRLFSSDDHVNIQVHDNGAGIPMGIRSKVFLPNFSTKEGGSGLGLAIAKRGTEHAGGSIWFETTEGIGTSFFVTLPLATDISLAGRTPLGAGQPNGKQPA